MKPLQENMLDEAVDVMLSAFQKEAFTAAWLDLSRPKLRRRYAHAVKLKFRLYLEAGHPILVAVEKGRVIGLLVLNAPGVVVSRKRFVRLLIPLLPRLIWLAPYFFRAIPLGGATKPPGGLPEAYYTLEAMAVDPMHQGKGVGRLLLEKAEELSFASESEAGGIYLFTGDEKNYHIYLRFGYQLLEKKQAGLFSSYHMFLGAPPF